ncbi:hypothetical protein K6Y31_09670 [Motilimonas cestriensis]|uniref:Uncharacterized protein n=1 Tax=Motilimonas cestriensis TaxID=2742685 RepID=A0ABS8WCL8_9GAMM|nr:hypothetical protein [Motilimonas cestriensis]MCE2595085.1 hypothetical protein [Motilimonas cestriensis]
MLELKLEQKSFPFKTTVLEVFSDRDMTVTTKSLFNTSSFTMPIDQLSARPTRHRKIKIVGILTFVVSFIVSIVATYYLSMGDISQGSGERALFALIIFGTISLFSFSSVMSSYTNLLIFTDGRTREGIFAIKPSTPSETEVTGFVNALEARLKSISYGTGYSRSEMQVIYSKHLEFLLNEQVITQDEYQGIFSRMQKTEQNIVSLVR